MEGDLTAPRFGLTKTDFETLAEQTDTVFHVAASVDLFGDYETLRRTNLEGTLEILHFADTAARSGFRHLHYVSTAYVAGQRQGLVLESELDKGQAFNNAYERVKWEAEKEVEAAKKRLPLTIYRPGIIVGDSRTGWTPCFNVIYEPIRLMFARKLPFIPNDRKSRLDIVPVDFVADAIAHLAGLKKETAGKTFHLTAGPGNGLSPFELARAGKKAFDQFQSELGYPCDLQIPARLHPLLVLVLCRLPGLLSGPRGRRAVQKWAAYSRYARYFKDFDTREAARLLAPAGLQPPSPADYLPLLLRYALEQNFGRPATGVNSGSAGNSILFSSKTISHVAQS